MQHRTFGYVSLSFFTQEKQNSKLHAQGRHTKLREVPNVRPVQVGRFPQVPPETGLAARTKRQGADAEVPAGLQTALPVNKVKKHHRCLQHPIQRVWRNPGHRSEEPAV